MFWCEISEFYFSLLKKKQKTNKSGSLSLVAMLSDKIVRQKMAKESILLVLRRLNEFQVCAVGGKL